MQNQGNNHEPVMRERITELLLPALSRANSVYVDGTLGLAGHSIAILQAAPKTRLVGIDKDSDALEIAKDRLAGFGDRVHLVQADYKELDSVLESVGITRIDAMLLDLGLSSLQIDRRQRGFAYSVDAPLDMRMDTRGSLDAAQVVNSYSVGELTTIFRAYGEERFADRIAHAIVAEREREYFSSSAKLVSVISAAIPAAARKTGGHPAKRVFQALRIEVNSELAALEKVLPIILDRLNVGGRLAVLAYHSLEDRLVKTTFRNETTDQVPPDLPIIPAHLQAKFALITRGAERPNVAEITANPRAAAARLRVIERTKETR